MSKHYTLLPAALLCLLAANQLSAQVNITTTATPYTQNFNTLITSGTSSTLPTGWVLLETGTNANTTLAADAGAGTTGNTYSYGTGTATDRAFGGLRSGSLIPTQGVQIRNSTGATITSLSISYTGEQWRCGTTGRTDQVDFQYSLNATSLSTGAWTDVNALDFASPSTTSVGAKDGNAAANRTAKSTLITGVSIANNAIFWLRWNDLDASGADDGLSIDDFSIQLNGADVTAPTTSTVTPANGSTGIALSGNLVITFSENIQKGTTGNITVKRTSDNVTVQTTAVTSASVTVSSNSATIPYSGLANSIGYYVNIDAGAFKDLAGNNHAGISGSSTWAFTTLAGGGGGGPLNFYFGNLHSHSSYSDGNADNTTKIPSDDYTYAKTALCMDFLGISEHNHATAGMHIANWQPGRTQAAAATTSTFVGLYGMEWGVISGGGHVIVYGMDSLIGWEAGNYDIFVAKNVYTGTGGLFDILNRHGGNALAYLAHPNNTDFNNVLNNPFDVNADNAIVGSTVETGPAFSTNTTYTNPGTSMAHLSYYRNMLSKGYHLGPTIDHDNHNMTFGHTAKTRLVIQAASLTENNLLDGMKKMRFYASQDCSAKIDFTISSEYIGSIVTKAGAPVISVTSTATTSAVTSVAIMYGVPGSGTAATQLTSNASGTFTYTDNALANGSQRYYYLDITEANGSRIVTSPIWYTRNDAAKGIPPSLTSFFTVNETDRVILKWTTENEPAEQWFEVQRSADGINYESLGTVTGKGMAGAVQTYALSDMQPVAGVSYYRLVQRNGTGEIRFTDVKVVNRGKTPASYYTIYPNPVQGMLNIRLTAATSSNALAEIFDLNGRKMINRNFNVIGGQQTLSLDMSRLGNGTYLLKLTLDGKTSSQLVNKF
ncbi:MAG: Ig-like domain-containing protein [Chitinophagaceae bacterium]